MADNGRWFKLWCSAVGDPDLDNLDIADFGRWAKLGAFIKEHGERGRIVVESPARSLCAKMQIPTFEDLKKSLEKLPNLSVSYDNGELTVTFNNWRKYQEDSTVRERVKNWREKRSSSVITVQEEKRGEEKRGEEKAIPPYGDIVAYLNQKTGQNYKPTTKDTREHIKARWEEGATLDDFKKAIDNTTSKWLGDPKMSQYLRPSTIFSKGKFEGYVNLVGGQKDWKDC